MQNHKDLKVWEKARSFTLQVYEATLLFPKEEIYSLTNQLRRAASSIPANIVEGCGKNAKQEFAQPMATYPTGHAKLKSDLNQA